jgi:hypothetical protein
MRAHGHARHVKEVLPFERGEHSFVLFLFLWNDQLALNFSSKLLTRE